MPQSVIPNLLDVVIRNSGYTPAYHVTFKFSVDLYHHEKSSLANLPIFKKPIPIIEPGQEIRFFYGSLPSILSRGGAFGKKQTTVTIEYTDVNKNAEVQYNWGYRIHNKRGKDFLGMNS